MQILRVNQASAPLVSARWWLGLLLVAFAVLGVGGCASGPRCHGPSQAVTPARSVPAPMVGLAGVLLDVTPQQAQQECVKLGGDSPKPGLCRPRPGAAALTSDPGFELYSVDAVFDQFGHAKRITAHYVSPPEQVEQQVGKLVAQISEVLGETRGGDLAWCGQTAGCNLSSYAEWSFEGGQVELRGRRDGVALELELSHSHNDMQESVIYGLPTCG